MKVCPRCAEIFPDDAGFCPADGEELKRSTDPYLGRTIASRYRLTKRLGAGGMSIVYLARHVIIDRLSAIKILRGDLGSNPAHRERFLREARAVNRINHRNIVEITDVGESDGVAYLVMEYVSGESLLAHIQRGAFTWRRAVAIAQQIASALARAHQAGVIHRDLKPENIMIVPQEESGSGAGFSTAAFPPFESVSGEMVKITDFGIAKIMDAPALTFSEQLFGTPGYIAPEYVEGLAIDYRADLYSLGVVMYEMLSGTLPYDARGQADLLLKPLTTSPNPLSQHAQVPPELEALTMRLLQKKPEDRPFDAFVVIDALADIVRRNTSQNPPAAGSSAPPVQAFVPSQQQVPREDLLTLIDPIIEVDPEALMPQVPASIRSLPPPPMEEPAPPRMPSEPPPQTPNVGKVVTREMAHRWQSALAELRASIERARERGGKYAERAERAMHLERLAAELVPRVERAAKAVSELQGRVDRLEASGREFRASLGRAIDELSRDRSREHTQLDALRAERDGGPTSSSSPPSQDARAWERGALLAEIERLTAVERDLGFQIDTLQQQLDRKNEEHAKQMLEASGQLEGAIAALRHLSGDLVKTLDEAIGIVAGGAPGARR